MEPTGTIVFATVGVTNFGFDVFSAAVPLPSTEAAEEDAERRHTDGVSVNFNAQFVDDGGEEVAFVSERGGVAGLFRCRPGSELAEPLPTVEGSLFHDRPTVRGGRMYYVSAHEQPPVPFRSWAAVYATEIGSKETVRVSPPGVVDMSPAVSASGELVAVASYGDRPWAFDFRVLETEVAVFRAADPARRFVVAERGGWPTWHGEGTVFFHRVAEDGWWSEDAERRHTDGVSVNFNAQFVDDGGEEVAFVSERRGATGLFRCRPGCELAEPLPTVEGSLFHDCPTVRGGRMYFISAHEQPPVPFRSWAAVYATVRVSPLGVVDMRPAVSASGELVAVASYGDRPWARRATENFSPLTERLNPKLHHYNPFFSPSGDRVGYHRFRGAGAPGDSVVPYLQPVRSPVSSLRMLRVYGTFPSFSPDAGHLAMNGDFFKTPGVTILRSDGAKRWVLTREPNLFYTAWSPTESGVIFTSMGPIFETPKATVRIARLEFDAGELTTDRDEVAATLKVLTRPEAGNDAFPAVSPFGKWIVFRSGRSGHKNLYIVDAAHGEDGAGEGTIRQLTHGEWIDTMPSWSPDGSLIAFSSNRHDPTNAAVFSIYLVRPDGSDLRRVHVAGPAGSAAADKERINHVCFSPDSRWLLFTANFGGVMAEPISAPNQFQPYGDLYVCRLDGSGLVRLTCNAYENGTPAWGPASAAAAAGMESLSLGSPAGDESLGEFDEPLWLTCDV
uniref:Dipeptidylpeptidase IV N-terminal domain-containing protein n=1 Tax=Oryza punctata TaxID=4537 RepID=A0A0E0LNW0_ORYPU